NNGMLLRKSAIILIIQAIFWLLFGAPVLAVETNMNGFDLTMDLQNNYMSFDSFFSAAAVDHEINTNQVIPATIYAKESLNCQIALSESDSGNMGCFLRDSGWLWSSGETPRFIQDSSSSQPLINGRFYDLGIRYQKYSIAGFYAEQEFRTSGLSIGLEEDLFICYNYKSMEFIGQGLLTKGTEGKQIDIYGQYRRTLPETGDLFGWGGSLSWKVKYVFGSDSANELNLQIRNLPGIIFFPDLVYENGRIDSSQNTIGPVLLEGFVTDNPSLINMPVEIKSNIFFKLFYGKTNLEFSCIGEVRDISVGYQYPVSDQFIFESKYNLVMNNLSLGCLWSRGKLNITLNPQNNWVMSGLVAGILF
ncbi:MAG TPA: hypothetical protein VHY08_12345, partial [Bacillota bacterium]|nr:hypothetical protein [Bacillota bacterium]